MFGEGFQGGTSGKEPTANARDTEMKVWFLGQEDPLEEDMAAHASILAWLTLWTEGPGRLQSIVLQRVGHNWSDLAGMQCWLSNEIMIYIINIICLFHKIYLSCLYFYKIINYVLILILVSEDTLQNYHKLGILKQQMIGDFFGGPVVKNPTCNAGDTVSIPGWGTKIPHALGKDRTVQALVQTK